MKDTRKTEEKQMAVLAVPVENTFEVAPEKTELFLQQSSKGSGKQAVKAKLEKCKKGNVTWDLKK